MLSSMFYCSKKLKIIPIKCCSGIDWGLGNRRGFGGCLDVTHKASRLSS